MNTINLTQNQFNYLCEKACVDCRIALENDNIVATLKLTNVSVFEKMELITNILNIEF